MMDFGEALRALKEGKRVARKGWNGKGQYVILAYMKSCSTMEGNVIIDPEHKDIGGKFLMFVGTSGYQCGWLASQADMLAEDWVIIGEDM